MDTVPSSRFHASRPSHRIPEMGKTLAWAGACISCAISLSTASIAREAIDYAGYYAKGMTFAAFLDAATSHPDDWRKGYSNAAVTADTVSRLRALPARRLLLVVADDSAAIDRDRPYVHDFVDAAPDRLALRVINSGTGRPIMEAHRTSDGRAATPTVVVLAGDGTLIGAWSERPSVLQAWVLEHKPTLTQSEFRDRKAK